MASSTASSTMISRMPRTLSIWPARGVPFLFATGYGENCGAPEGFDAPIVRKPYDVAQIATALAELTGRA